MSSALPDYDTIIVGAGFSGIGTAIKLDRAKLGNYLLIEAGDGVGGTWHWNTYPGIAVDVPSSVYQFSFEQRLDMRMFGLGLAVAVLVDATIVRMMVLPAFMHVLGQWNWWSPAPLARLHERIGMGEGDSDAGDTPCQRRCRRSRRTKKRTK